MEWKTGPSNTIAAVQELYQQLLPTKLYHHKKTGINTSPDVLCRMCGKCQESVTHILSGCSTLARTKNLARHSSALKILFFEMLRDQNLVSKVPPWYSPVQPKPMYENNNNNNSFIYTRFAINIYKVLNWKSKSDRTPDVVNTNRVWSPIYSTLKMY